jgi:hypothetical protein
MLIARLKVVLKIEISVCKRPFRNVNKTRQNRPRLKKW